MNALYILLLEGDTDRVLDAIASVLGRKDPQAQAFARLWKTLDDTLRSGGTPDIPTNRNTCSTVHGRRSAKPKSGRKRRCATTPKARGNDRLDTAMRLFSYASAANRTA